MIYKMVYAVSISQEGIVGEVQIPPKTADVLEWVRKKYKNPSYQFQGNIAHPLKENFQLNLFACIAGEDDSMNQHLLPSPFDEESYTGHIVILMSEDDEEKYGVVSRKMTDKQYGTYAKLAGQKFSKELTKYMNGNQWNIWTVKNKFHHHG